MYQKPVYFLSFIVLFYSQISAQYTSVFNDGDTVVLIGDSITHGGTFHTFLQLFTATQFPNKTINYYNCGVSGDNAIGTIDRLEKDILTHNPSHAIIMLGMNDIGLWKYPINGDEKN